MFKQVVFCIVLVLFAGHVSAKQWDVVADGKAVGDGQADCTAIFQGLLNEAAKAGGGIVNVPAGQYRFDGTLSIPASVTLQGTFRVPPSDQRSAQPTPEGSVLLAYAGRGKADGEPFIRLAGSMATLTGFMIRYPEWKHSDVPPVPYPPTVFSGRTDNTGVLECCFLNSYEAIHFDGAARFLIRNVHGYPCRRGIFVDNCYDIGRVENCHIWPFGVVYNPSDPYCKWINENGVAFEFARTDWQYVLNTFCFGYGVGYKFSAYKTGGCNGNFVGIGADCCRRSILVEDAQPYGLLITNGEFVGRWENQDSVGVEIAPGAHSCKVSLNNCAFWGPLDRCVWSRSPNAQFTSMATIYQQWDVGALGSAAIQVDAGKAIVQGNTFGDGEVHVQVGEKVRSAIIMGNQADDGVIVGNSAGKKTQVVANESCEVELGDKALEHYRVLVGTKGDRSYLHKWFCRDASTFWSGKKESMRWSRDESVLRLPVLPRKKYDFSLHIAMFEGAVDPAGGVYLGDKRIAELPAQPGPAVLTASIPPQDGKQVTLTLRAKGWIPMEKDQKSRDARRLGIAVRAIEMKADGAASAMYNANTGEEIRH